MNRPLPPELQDWITASLVNGGQDANLIAGLAQQGYDPQYATCAVAVIRSMTERVQQSNPELLRQYDCDPIRLPAGVNKLRVGDREVEIVVSMTNPNIAVIRNLLAPQECEKLIQLSRGKLTRSQVVASTTGHLELSKVRTSEGTHFEYGENAIVQRLEARIAALFGRPVDTAEPAQILHYHVGGEYLAHHDYFDPSDAGSAHHIARGGQRIATLVTYLNDVELGGETHFPELDLSIRPSAGSAVYFEYCNSQGQLDTRCLHAGVPVLRGEKWIATKWFRQERYRT
jgi:prolyl 4-hydroxylase